MVITAAGLADGFQCRLQLGLRRGFALRAQEKRRVVSLAGVTGAQGILVVMAEGEPYRMLVKVVGNGS
jgi:hypothetical protein